MEKEMQYLKSKLVDMVVDKVRILERTGNKSAQQHFLDNYINFRDLLRASRDDAMCVFDLRRRLLKSQNLNSKETTLINVLLYLLLVEGMICNVLNFISYSLVAKEHDLYSLTKRKYVKDDIEEIRKVEMSTKIQFLKHHGFGSVCREYDSTFRNDIAHHNYRIDEKGVLRVRGKSINLASKTRPLFKILDFMIETGEEIKARI